MKLSTTPLLALTIFIAVLVPASGCGAPEGCEAFAEHLADVLAKEQGTKVAADVREKMVKKTVESCAAQPPDKAALDCAIKAETSAAMKACEGGDEAEAKDAKAEAKADGKAGAEADAKAN